MIVEQLMFSEEWRERNNRGEVIGAGFRTTAIIQARGRDALTGEILSLLQLTSVNTTMKKIQPRNITPHG